jgi:hypothetical protein
MHLIIAAIILAIIVILLYLVRAYRNRLSDERLQQLIMLSVVQYGDDTPSYSPGNWTIHAEDIKIIAKNDKKATASIKWKSKDGGRSGVLTKTFNLQSQCNIGDRKCVQV